VLLCVVAGVFALGGGVASAAVLQFGSVGEEAGQFREPQGVAVDQETGDVYVGDGNSRVDKFDGAGNFLLAWGEGVADGTTRAPQTCTTTCFEGLGGTAGGEFSGVHGVAVDNDPLSSSHGDVYALDFFDFRVEKFDSSGKFLLALGGEVNKATKGNVCLAGEECQAGTRGTADGQFEYSLGVAIAVGLDGTVYVGDRNRVQRFSAEGAFLSAVALPEAGEVYGLAVDSAGDLYVASESSVHEYDPAGTLLHILDAGGSPKGVTLDTAGDVFVDDDPYPNHKIIEYDPSGAEIAAFDFLVQGGGHGIAFAEGAKALYVLSYGAVRMVAPPPPGPLVVEGSESAGEVQPTSVVLGASIDPENNDTTYHFEYGTSASYGASVPVPDADVGSGFENHAVSVAVSGLSVSTAYHYRVVARDSKGHVTDGPDQTFTTLPPALIDSESVVEVASGSATLQAQLNPLGSDTTYHFEYGTSTAYGESAPIPDADAGAGRGDVAVGVHVQDLQPSMTYHYRVVAQNALGSVQGEDHTFTTQAAGGGFALLDGRSWEMVSPPDKQGAGLQPMTREGGAIQAASGGGAITYVADAPTESEPSGNRAVEVTQLLSRRSAEGWATKVITPHEEEIGHYIVGNNSQYWVFSPDLSLGLLKQHTEVKLSEEAVVGTEYLRHDYTCEANPGSCYEPLLTTSNTPSGTKFDSTSTPVAVVGTPDLSHVLVSSKEALISGLPNSEIAQSIYEWAGGSLRLVSILPDGKPAAEEGFVSRVGSAGSDSAVSAISEDGSRVVFSAEPSVFNGQPPHLYMRDIGQEDTVQLDTVEPGLPGGSGVPKLEASSSDESRVFFTDEAKLTADSTAYSRPNSGERSPDLYEFDVETGKLTDLSVDPNHGEHADVLGLVQGVSRDGSYVYFVADGVLAPGALPGHCAGSSPPSGATCNLYVRHAGATTFIARLSYRDQKWFEESFFGELSMRTARVSPNGRWFAFMSERSLTGYDNRDAGSGERDEEVFLYDAATSRLSCVSCDPTGSRPAGVFETSEFPGLLPDYAGNWIDRWVSGLIPGWTKASLGNSLYQSRYLSDSGRLFFDSYDALVAQDVNGTGDVYEYEPAGVGSCTSASQGFREALGGCVGLISSGGSAEESAFMDATENGDEAFFLTAARLLPQDFDNSLDLYNARVCTSSSPCLPVPPVSPPACTTGDSCKPAPSPQPTVFGPPPSATFSGVGNFAPSTAGVAPRSLTRAQKLGRALRACHRKHSKHKRAACERQARRRYGARSARKGYAAKGSTPVLSIASGR
jgi:hypothetical protein